MTDADQIELDWLRAWRRKMRSAMRLWLNATGYRDGCNRLTDLKAVFNEPPPDHNPDRKAKGQEE